MLQHICKKWIIRLYTLWCWQPQTNKSNHNHYWSEEDYEYKFTVLIYFAKDWIKGSPGGTYICESEDESTIVFEPTDLDNSWICFAETPNSWHGSRYMTHEIPRPSIQFAMV